MDKIDKLFKFHKNDTIVVACSTGPDSMALLDMLLKIRNFYKLKLIVAHVNHNIRRESIQEEEYIKKYCSINNLLFECMTIENYGDDNFHNEARNIRYHFFDEVVNKYSADYLMTAHHGDDLIETILMRIVRGSHLEGYGGFKVCVNRKNYKIVRPLICYTKSELEEYDKINGIKYFIDKSNNKDKYTRNRFRKYVLPFLKEEDNNVHLKFYKFSKILNEASLFIEEKTLESMNKVLNENNNIKIDIFKLEDSFLQREIIYKLLVKFYPDDLILLNDRHIDLIINLIYSNRANGFINLPNNIIVKKKYNEIEIIQEIEDINNYEIELDKTIVLPNNHKIEYVSTTSSNSNYVCRLNSKDIKLPLIVRTRKIGDRMYVKGLNGSKKIKDIFIDSKIDKEKRDLWPVVVDSIGNILWIPGLKKSKFDKSNNESYDIILKYS